MGCTAAAVDQRYGPGNSRENSGDRTTTSDQTVSVSASVDVRLHRVGFRAGTDAELRALHAVEVPIQAERGSDRMPQPVA